MKPSEIVDKALDILGSEGEHWGKHHPHQQATFISFDGEKPCVTERWCLMGALGEAATGNPYLLTSGPGRSECAVSSEVKMAHEAIRDVIATSTGGLQPTVIAFNDYMDRKFDDVREVMEKARAGLQEKGL